MTLLESIGIALGTTMPSFELEDSYGDRYTLLNSVGEKGLLIIFSCNHCPYAQAVWPRLIKLAKLAKALEITTLAINPNIHPDYPEDSPDEMAKYALEMGINFPYLIDADQSVARAYDAQCTPDIYLLDHHRQLRYHGRVDDNWQDEALVKREELKEAILSLGNGRAIPEHQFPTMGCSIKWVNRA